MEEKDIDKLKSDQTDDRDYTVEDINDIMPTNKDDYGMEDIDSIADIDNIVGTVSPDTDSDQINNIYAADGSDPDEGTDEEIVFASSGTKRESVPKKNAAPVSALSLPKIPVKAVAIAVAALIGIGLLSTIISCFGNRSVPTSADADNSGGQIDHLTVPQGNSEYEIKNINTSNIKFGDNVTVEGVSLSGKTLSQAFDEMQSRLKDLRDEINITINCDDESVTLTQDDFTFDTDVSDVLIQAYHYSRGELDIPTVATSNENGTTDFKVTSTINSGSIANAVKKAAKEFDVPPKEARVTKFDPDAEQKFTYADGSDGYMINQNEVIEKVSEILSQSDMTGIFSVNKVKTPYSVTLAQVKANTKLIASHRTTVNNRWESNANMELAIEAASGTIVKPGETFSFNKMTGDTTNGDEHHYPNGTVGSYLPSTAILNGEHVDQYGGGICQASTTIYNCAVKADMEIVERHSHQYPSFYAELGLDATVDYGNLDMKFKNTKDFPIYIATYVYDSNGDGLNELNVEMYGPISADYDEIVPVGWVTSASPDVYSAKGAKVYFKDGKEIKRIMLPEGSYDYYSDGFYDVTTQSYAESLIAEDPVNGPSVDPTGESPSVYSPNGCGDNGPIEYGTEKEYLEKAGLLN